MKAKIDEDATQSKKDSLINEKKTEYYNDTIEKWKDAVEFDIDKKAWDSIKVNKKAIYTELHESDTEESDTTVTATDDGGTVTTDDSSVSVGVTASDGGEVNTDVAAGTAEDMDSTDDTNDESTDTTEDKETTENDNNIDDSSNDTGIDME